jgi:signal transduction histidine kinase
MMDIHIVPMLLSGVLCTLISVTTWLFRRRESINRAFSFFTLTLALDSFAFFAWFQFGSPEAINTWLRLTCTAGFLVPMGLVLFVFAFTGYDKRPDARILGIRVRHFQVSVLLLCFLCMLLAQSGELIISISGTPEDIWDFQLGPLGILMFPIFAGVFAYLLVMVVRCRRETDDEPRRRFILLLVLGTGVWVLFGFGGALILSPSTALWQSISYLGTAVMAMLYFVAILNYQSDKVHELNLSLERKVDERTRHLKEARSQLIQSETMASLGHLVAGVAHEMNTPVGAVYSTHSTLTSAADRLQQTLERDHGITVGESPVLSRILGTMAAVGDVIQTSGERMTGIVKRLRMFARLDEADLQSVDFHECVENALSVFEFHLKAQAVIRREYADLPPITCYPAQINQLCLQLLRNANRAIEETGEIVLRTEIRGSELRFSVGDDGRGIRAEDVGRIFDPGYTGWDVSVGTGLGLAICYQIAEEHRGQITVESEVGEGSTFTFSLPLDGSPRTAVPVTAARGQESA